MEILVSLIYHIYRIGSCLILQVLLLKGMHKLLGILILTNTPTQLNQPNLPTHLGQPNAPHAFS